MTSLKIDNVEISVPEGTRLIEAARQNGINIPSLCYDPDLPHFSSCMVCMVKNTRTGKYIPSCSAIAEDGMEIDATGSDIKQIRSEALSMLLSEHRAECEAPCRLVCPAGLNIPLFNRLIRDGKLEEATKLAFKEMGDPSAACIPCPRYCEKACRRKMIDNPIAISQMVIFLTSPEGKSLDNTNVDSLKEKTATRTRLKRSDRKFNSTLGKINDEEKREWLKECPEDAQRVAVPSSNKECSDEAANCMHCDCRAAGDCRLRELCHLDGISNPRIKSTAYAIEKKVDRVNGIIFEHAKCIKCGLCVRVMENRTNGPSLCFTGRGFMSIISEPLAYEFNEVTGKDISRAVEICPTGALTREDK